MYFFENFEEPIIEDLDGVVFVIGVTIAYGHGISVKRIVDLFLAGSFVQGTSPDVHAQFFGRKQRIVFFYLNRKKGGLGCLNSCSLRAYTCLQTNGLAMDNCKQRNKLTEGKNFSLFFLPGQENGRQKRFIRQKEENAVRMQQEHGMEKTIRGIFSAGKETHPG